MFQDALETIHRQFGPQIQAFHGDGSPLAPSRSILQGCLVSQARETKPPTAFHPVLVAAALIVLAIGGSGVPAMAGHTALECLSRSPQPRAWSGGALERTSQRQVLCRRPADPLARDPSTLIAGTALPGSVESRWEPYQALLPAFVTARATDLAATARHHTRFQDGTLTIAGSGIRVRSETANAWHRRSLASATTCRPGTCGASAAEARGHDPSFQGQAQLEPDQQTGLRDVERLLAELNETLRARGRAPPWRFRATPTSTGLTR